jgi:phosphatidylserine decarboxylase
MKTAKGSTSWIITPFIVGLLFLILTIFLKDIIGNILFLISTISLLLTIFFLVFFRDPERNTGKDIVAVADGKIREITDDKEILKISTFMNIYDVHVNRMPIDGIVKNVEHINGSHLPAFKKESERNERVITTIETNIGTVKIVQIAGTLARRIVPYIKKGDKLKKGDRIGIIRLGSRVDLYLPSKKMKKINVKVGDMIKAGEGTLAEIND